MYDKGGEDELMRFQLNYVHKRGNVAVRRLGVKSSLSCCGGSQTEVGNFAERIR